MNSKNDKKRYYKLTENLPEIEKIDGKFIDEEFLNNDDSLFYYDHTSKNGDEMKTEFESKLREYGEKVEWQRILDKDKNNNSSNFNLIEENDINNNLDIIQGIIGDCYLISYLHCLEKFSGDIFSSIIRKTDPEKGYIEINFFIKEKDKIEPIIVIVDDFIPCYKFKNMKYYVPFFSQYRIYSKRFKHFLHYFKIKDKDLIQYGVGIYLLIEKAYAKLKGSYLQIIDSKGNEPFLTLTGCDYKEYYIHKEYLLNNVKSENIKNEFQKKNYMNTEKALNEINKEKKEEIFKKLEKIIDENLVMTGSQPFDGSNSLGIIGHHRYCIMNYKTYKNKNFFGLWNPHGKNPKIKQPNLEPSQGIYTYIWTTIKSWFTKIFSKTDINYLYYDGQNEINNKNKLGIDNGEIFLCFEHFFMSFERIYFQNKEDLKNSKKIRRESIFSSFFKINPIWQFLLFNIYRIDIRFLIPMILILNFGKKENNDQYLTKIEEEKEDINELSDDDEIQLSVEEDNNSLSNWVNVKEEIIKESKRIIKEKLKEDLDTINLNEFKNLLYDICKEKNKYYKIILKYKEKIPDEKLSEINLEIERIIKEEVE